MTRIPTIFISYNPKSREEETLAVRLQTIGTVNGFQTHLPDRFVGKGYVDAETISRINSSDYFVLFLTKNLSKIVQDEIDVAYKHFQDASKILIIYDQFETHDFMKEKSSEVTLVPFDPQADTVDVVIKKVIDKISNKERSQANQNGLFALIGIGLGLWALSTILADDEE